MNTPEQPPSGPENRDTPGSRLFTSLACMALGAFFADATILAVRAPGSNVLSVAIEGTVTVVTTGYASYEWVQFHKQRDEEKRE